MYLVFKRAVQLRAEEPSYNKSLCSSTVAWPVKLQTRHIRFKGSAYFLKSVILTLKKKTLFIYLNKWFYIFPLSYVLFDY